MTPPDAVAARPREGLAPPAETAAATEEQTRRWPCALERAGSANTWRSSECRSRIA